jgi:hypothetical protein
MDFSPAFILALSWHTANRASSSSALTALTASALQCPVGVFSFRAKRLSAGSERGICSALLKNRQKRTYQGGQGVLKFQRALSLLGSNLTSEGVLLPTAVKAKGKDFGMMR